jgi:hypothetical protein
LFRLDQVSIKEAGMTEGGDFAMEWSRWFGWVLATALGAAVGLTASVTITLSIGSMADVDADALFGAAAALLLGILTGSAEWMVLKRYIPRAGWWVAATLGGYIAVLILTSLSNVLGIGAAMGAPYSIALTVIIGAALGVPQYLVLKEHFPNSGWWVLASSIGMLGSLLGGIYPAHNIVELVILGATMGAIWGGVTGIALVWLLRNRSTNSTNVHEGFLVSMV